MWEFLNDKIFTTWTSPERPFCYWVPLLNLATTTPSAGRGWQASTENGWLAPLSYATSTCLQCNDKWTPINLLWTKTTGTWVYFLFFKQSKERGRSNSIGNNNNKTRKMYICIRCWFIPGKHSCKTILPMKYIHHLCQSVLLTKNVSLLLKMVFKFNLHNPTL